MLVDEAERTRRYPGIAFRGNDHQRRPWVIGSPFDVWEVVQAWQDLHEDSAATAEQLRLSEHKLGLALAYYREFTDEIDAALVLARRGIEQLQREHPFFEALLVDGQ